MSLPVQTIRKLYRDGFPGTAPMVVDPAKRAEVAADLKKRIERIEGVDVKDRAYVHDGEKPRHVTSFSIADPGAYYAYRTSQSFRLDLDDANRLILREAHGHYTKKDDSAVVSDLDEVVRFLRECKQRLDRRKALTAQRGKIRGFTAQAIQAQVRKLARENKFDFIVDTDDMKVNLYVKITEDRAVIFPIPYKGFEQLLPRLKPAIAALRKLHEGGIYFRNVTTRKVPYRKTWTTYQSLAETVEDSVDDEENDE